MSVPVDVIENPTQPDSYGIFPVRELEVETGFSSYVAYLEARGSDYYELADILRDMKGLRKDDASAAYSAGPSHCFITDVSKKRDRAFLMRLDLSSGPDYRNENRSSHFRDVQYATALRLFKGLRSPTEDDSIRVVTWYIEASRLVPEWVDVIGLGLQVPPSFFMALLQKIQFPRASRIRAESRFLYPQHHVIGPAVATYLSGRGLNGPTILIAHIYLNTPLFPNDVKIVELLELEVDGKLPFKIPRATGPSVNGYRPAQLCKESFARYQKLFRDSLEQESDPFLSDQSLFYSSLVPLFRTASTVVQTLHRKASIYLTKLQDEHHMIGEEARDEQRNNIRDETYDSLDHERFQLRRAIEDCENARHFFVNYIVSNGNAEWLNGHSYRTMTAYSDYTTQVAKRLEVEIRDYMQIVVGALSIDESRKSIELANAQIQEGQKVTLLALVYVPLNLATSIFGMNLQQLNDNGQPLWIFIATAIIAMTLTGLVWFCIDQISSVRRWVRMGQTMVSDDRYHYQDSPDYGLGVRFAMIYYLMRWGHTKWMLRSNIWIHVLMNGSKPGQISVERRYTIAAGHYVSRCLRRHGQLDPDTENVKW